MDNSEYRTLNVIGVGTSGRGLKTLNNKNNLEDLYLKKKLVHYKREHTYSIAHLDRDRFDTHDFMKHILQIESDSHPAAIQYLGRDPKKPTRQGPRRHRTAPGDSDQESDSEHHPTPIPVKTPNYNQSRKSMMLPPTTQITLSELPNQDESAAVGEIKSVMKESLPSLDRKKSIYLQIAAVTSKTEDNTCASSDSQSEHDSDNELFRSDGRKKSFMAWMQEQKSDKDKVALARIQLKREDPLVRRRNEFHQWMADRKEQRERTAKTYSHLLDSSGLGDVNQLLVPQNLGSSNGMSSLSPTVRQLPSFASVGRMVGNMGKVRKRPIKDRMSEFCKKCEHLKLENATIELTDAQIKRRWKMRTKGVRAALADSSDDDDEA
ncbi:uncharacterized protein LOC110453709 [Mizuhopecten yessoensis]|uniref:Uncharacterized protein n=1 Tax=Mizuhopecten yessoensis TaxID=6573 RepID=A0A210QGT0_MIZYE|nr:uncharacterized protein LOC110453709 [Mizuhopecten yessoensis]OWF47964.1 hypothetical protein KP79_PYT17957 [Mizuhopecten yessoensis]